MFATLSLARASRSRSPWYVPCSFTSNEGSNVARVRLSMADGAPYWMLWEELVTAGSHWSGLLRRGTTLRLTDVAGGANVSALLFNDDDRLERYNMPDTLKAQHTAFLTSTCVCYSDM